MSNFDAGSSCDDVLEGHDLTGTAVLITGGYSGLGFETARSMALKGADVIIAGRSAEKLADAARELNELTGRDITTLTLDLGSLQSVRDSAAEALKRFEKIDLLINNAGVMACPKGHTADGFEMQFGTNHLGHFLFTNLLMPLIEKGKNKRIINLSSRAHFNSPVDFEDPNFETREYEKWLSYGQSKTANVLFSVELEKRLANKGIHSYAVHPGGIQTNLGRHLSEEDVAQLIAGLKSKDGGAFVFKTPAQGAATSCWAATAAELEGQGGVYCEDCHVAKTDDENPSAGVRSYALNAEAATQLWTMSEEMTGHSFSY
jgi:NAD(P)-dependent dehydrogenase (short-subunit alcohol dehydrogenase family)